MWKSELADVECTWEENRSGEKKENKKKTQSLKLD